MAEQEVAEQEEEWTHDTMIEGLWRTDEKKEISILYERQDKSRYSGQALEDSREWKDFFHKFSPTKCVQMGRDFGDRPRKAPSAQINILY